jgi:putative transposase
LIPTAYSVKNNPLAAPRTLTNKQKLQALYCLKAGIVKELQTKLPRLGVHRITINRGLKQYSAGGLEELLKIRQITGRPRLRAYYPKFSKK